MKRFGALCLSLLLMTSCDDGDLIVTDFNFENQELQWCGDTQNQVLFNINNDQVHEAIAFRFDLETPEVGFLTQEETQLNIPLNSENQVIYRIFDAEVDNSYFCNQVPPIAPRVTKEFRSTSGGNVLITSTLRNSDDHDADGILSQNEGMEEELDTDGDGILDYLDRDDDADNIPTQDEIEEEEVLDTDADGIPNYLDEDDDNDGTISRYEDWNTDFNPRNDTNDEGLAHYLNPEISDAFEVAMSRNNPITRSFRYLVTIENLTLVNQGGDGEQIRLQDYVLGYLDSPTLTEPGFEEEEPEEEEPGDQ